MEKKLAYESKIIAKLFVADTFIKRFMGYMFRKEPHYEALMINPCNSIHTFFMKFNIDVLFINENMEVVKKVEGLSKRKIIMPVKEAKFVIEGKEGLFEGIEVGSKIYFQ